MAERTFFGVFTMTCERTSSADSRRRAMGEPAKKRGAGKQLTKDDAGREEGGEVPTGSRPKADKGTMSARKVVKVKRAAKTPGLGSI